MKRIDWLRLLILSLVWGGSFLFYRVLATELPPLTTVFSRCMIGAAAVALFIRFEGGRIDVPRTQWPKLLVVSLFNNVIPFTLYAWGETRVPAGVAAIFNAATPTFTVLVTGLVLRMESLTAPRLFGVLCGLAGVAVVVGPDVLVGADLGGEIACLLAPICYGFGFPYARRYVTGMTPPSIAFAQLAISAAVVLPLALLHDPVTHLPMPDLAGWLSVAGLGVLSTGFAYVVVFRVLASAGATNLSLVTLLVPVSALFLAWVGLGETVPLRALLGMALIAAGLAAIDGRMLRRFSLPPTGR